MSDVIENYLKFLVGEKILSPVSHRADTRFYLDGKQINSSKVYEIIKSPEFVFSLKDKINAPEILAECFSNTSFPHQVNALLDELRRPSIPETLKTAQISGVEELLGSDHLNNLKPYVDVKTSEIILWDCAKRNVSEISYNAYKAIVPNSRIEALKKWGAFTPCKKIYDPYSFEVSQQTTIDEIPAMAINTYRPAEWRLKNYKPHYPKELKFFIDYMFPVEEERHLVLTFLKHMILYRVSWIFLLIGSKGIGKTRFVDSVCKPLVGDKYFAKSPKGFFESRFQDVLINNRLLFFDEIDAKTSESKNDIKRLCNRIQSIEVKGKNSEQYHIYYSVIMANNSLANVKAESDDRRFFIPKTPLVPLKAVLTETEIQNLFSLLEQEDYYGPFGSFLLELEDSPHFHPENAYITETFYEAVELSMSEVEKFIVATVKSKEENFYPFKVLKKLYKGDQRFFSEAKIREFIKTHTDEGIPLGKIEIEDNEAGIKVNPHFL